MRFKKHIPNILSSLRLFSPLVLTPLIISANYIAAFVALCSFFMTDAIDGYLARKWKVQSELGAKIDAIADKMILLSLLLPLIINNPLILINLGLEGGISFINVKRKLEGGNPKTLQIGRIKMVILSLFMALSYLGNLVMMPNYILELFYLTTLVFQVKSINEYFMEMKRENRERIDNNKLNNSILDDIKAFESVDNINIDETINIKNENGKLQELVDEKKELTKLREDMINLSTSTEELRLNNSEFCKIKKR